MPTIIGAVPHTIGAWVPKHPLSYQRKELPLSFYPMVFSPAGQENVLCDPGQTTISV